MADPVCPSCGGPVLLRLRALDVWRCDRCGEPFTPDGEAMAPLGPDLRAAYEVVEAVQIPLGPQVTNSQVASAVLDALEQRLDADRARRWWTRVFTFFRPDVTLPAPTRDEPRGYREAGQRRAWTLELPASWWPWALRLLLLSVLTIGIAIGAESWWFGIDVMLVVVLVSVLTQPKPASLLIEGSLLRVLHRGQERDVPIDRIAHVARRSGGRSATERVELILHTGERVRIASDVPSTLVDAHIDEIEAALGLLPTRELHVRVEEAGDEEGEEAQVEEPRESSQRTR